MSDRYSYRTIEEFADAFESVRKQLRAMKWLFGFMVAAVIAGFAALFYFAQDFPRQASVLDSRERSLEKQGIQMQTIIKQMGAAFQVDLTKLGEKIDKAEQDVARLQIRLGGTGGDAASSQDELNREQKSNDPVWTQQGSAIAPQASFNDNTPPPLPKPRPRKLTQAPVTPRLAPSALASAGSVELKVGNQIAPGQFDLQPIPDELENKMPRLKGMAFFRFADQIFVVDPKDNRIVELLK
jgi:hypothetical protein